MSGVITADASRQHDHQINPAPQDSVSCIKFAPNKDYLVCTAWDNSVSLYAFQKSGFAIQSRAEMQMTQNPHTGPVLSACWDNMGTKVFTASADKQGKVWDLSSQQVIQFAQHDQPIKCVHWVEAHNMVVTASWDRTLKYWPSNSLGSGSPAATVTLPERVYAMDVRDNIAVVATADKNIHVFDVRANPQQPLKSHLSPLRHQVRTVALFSDNRGYAIGSIEGRVQIYHIQESDQGKNFAFKCHRDPRNQDIYAVNAIVFHKMHGTFCTAGSDGTFNFWDKDAKQRLKGFQQLPNSITCCDFNHTGDVFGYAVGYDWSKGYDQQNRQMESLWLHPIQDNEIRPKK
uniref:Anaphase-promoting complex subunit 4 WD40 domain-containing protein n=1 Tax=Hanusia phi TaxID=3032 RepID=A0A7S0F2S4_9CRYP|mmetsp:Transcript_36769/g.82853  ORF Transcript_36769/g.82853 Transcript_36769/m.82853 type:complete len:345 (+) Transcript_36769:18-1052(+)